MIYRFHFIPESKIKLLKPPDDIEIKAYWTKIKLRGLSGSTGRDKLNMIVVSATGVPYMEELIVEIIL